MGQLLAAQWEANATDKPMEELARSLGAFPDDLVNFHWDPLTCAVAADCSGVSLQEFRLCTDMDGGFAAGP